MHWTRRGKCSWYIIDRGCAKFLKLPLIGSLKKERSVESKYKKRKKPVILTIRNKLARTIYRWMFTWAEPYQFMNKDKFTVSKPILFHYLKECS